MTDLAQQIREKLDGIAAPGPLIEFPETMTAEDRQAFRDAWLTQPVPRIYTAPAVGRPLTDDEMDEWERKWDAVFIDLPQQPLKILPPGRKFYPGFEQMRAALLAVLDADGTDGEDEWVAHCIAKALGIEAADETR